MRTGRGVHLPRKAQSPAVLAFRCCLFERGEAMLTEHDGPLSGQR